MESLFSRMKSNSKKKGVSPVIATVLLIAMVMVVALIIFLWFRELGGETITKFGGKNIELVCSDVSVSGSYSGGTLSATNYGNVPVFQMKVKIEEGGDFSTENLKDIGTWPNQGLNPGDSISTDISSSVGGADKLTLIPILVGTSKNGEKTYVCDDGKYGTQIEI